MTTKSKYVWLNTALQGNTTVNSSMNAFSGNWTWVWVSGVTNTLTPFTYDNWGLLQSNNFNGDSIYLNTSDYKFYVGVGSNIYYNASFESIGVLCEIAASSLTTSQINILGQTSTQAYTSTGLRLFF